MTYDDPLNPTWPSIIKRTLWAYRWLLPLFAAFFFGMGAITYGVILIHLQVTPVQTIAEAEKGVPKSQTWEYVLAFVSSVIATVGSVYYMRKWKRDGYA